MTNEITWYDKDGTTFWSCGCETSAGIENGLKVAIHKDCGAVLCPVTRQMHKESNRQNKPIEHRRG